MIRQRSLCLIKPSQKERPTLLRNSSAKQIRLPNNSSRLATPHHPNTQNKQTLSRNISQTSREKEKEKEGEVKGQHPKAQKSKIEERKVESKDSVINIKKDLKLLISKNTSKGTKKQETNHQYLKSSKPKQKSITDKIAKIFANQEVPAKRHSICNLKVIKEEKYPKQKSNKSSASKLEHNSKEKNNEDINVQRNSNPKGENGQIPNPEGKMRPIFSLDSTHLTSSTQIHTKEVCRGSFGKGDPPKKAQNPNFLEFFKQYRNSFDLKGIRYVAERSKIKTFRQTTSNLSSDAYKNSVNEKSRNSPKVPTDPEKRLQHFLAMQSPIPYKGNHDIMLDSEGEQ